MKREIHVDGEIERKKRKRESNDDNNNDNNYDH